MTFSSRIYTFYYFVFCRCTRIVVLSFFFFLNDPAPPEIYTLSLHDALPISARDRPGPGREAPPAPARRAHGRALAGRVPAHGRPPRAARSRHHRSHDRARHGHRPRAVGARSEEHTSELQSRLHIVCRLLLEK